MSGIVVMEHVSFDSLRPHIAKAAEVIKDYTTIFAFNDGSFGSGTFVNIGGFTGILTADHVAAHLDRFADFSLVVAGYPHRLEATVKTVQRVTIGSPPLPSEPETGPDLSFVIIRNPTLVEVIQSEKLFYNMDFAHSNPLLAPTKPKSREVGVGNPAEGDDHHRARQVCQSWSLWSSPVLVLLTS